MEASPSPDLEIHRPLLTALLELQRLISTIPDQNMHRVAEYAAATWSRVLDGQEAVQPRLNASGYLPEAFHFGMETRPENQIDPLAPDVRAPEFAEILAQRLRQLRGALERFFHRTGYRNSTDQCDHLMVEVSRCSRFLGTACLMAQVRQPPGPEDPPLDLHAGEGRGTLLYETRFHFFLWEPFLNEAIVAWQQNSLEDFVKGLQNLHNALAAAAEGALPLLPDRGYPLRGLGKPRQKVILTVGAESRPLRGKSLFGLRSSQMMRRIATADSLSLRLVLELEREVRAFTGMVQRRRLLMATEPAFHDTGRAPLALIRNRAGTHPLLLDTTEFFKKALLFFNGTYTVAGGGLDPMYMQMRQLERHYRFDHWNSGKALRAPLEACLLGWEENRWDAFTAGIMEVAALLRGEAPPARG